MDENQFLEDFSLTLRNVLDSEMESTNLSESKIAERIGISKGALSHYKTGKRMPGIYTLGLIAQYFKVSPNTFLGYDDDLEADRRTVAQLYTGLSMKATEALHHNPLFSVVLGFLLEDEDHLDDLVGYFLSSLYRDLVQDERYNCLPGIFGIQEAEERKLCFNGIIDKLADYREEFYQWVTSKPKRKNSIIREIVYEIAYQEAIAQIRWPRATTEVRGSTTIDISGRVGKLTNFPSIKEWDAQEEKCRREGVAAERAQFLETYPKTQRSYDELSPEEKDKLWDLDIHGAYPTAFSTFEKYLAFLDEQKKQAESFFMEYEKRIQRQRKSEDDVEL